MSSKHPAEERSPFGKQALDFSRDDHPPHGDGDGRFVRKTRHPAGRDVERPGDRHRMLHPHGDHVQRSFLEILLERHLHRFIVRRGIEPGDVDHVYPRLGAACGIGFLRVGIVQINRHRQKVGVLADGFFQQALVRGKLGVVRFEEQRHGGAGLSGGRSRTDECRCRDRLPSGRPHPPAFPLGGSPRPCGRPSINARKQPDPELPDQHPRIGGAVGDHGRFFLDEARDADAQRAQVSLGFFRVQTDAVVGEADRFFGCVLANVDPAGVLQIALPAAHDAVVRVLDEFADGRIGPAVKRGPHDFDNPRNIDFEGNRL